MRIARRSLLLALAPLALASPARAQGAAPAPSGCDPDGPTPPFMSAANEIFYGCGALFRSTPPEYFSAIGRFRSALARDPENAAAEFLLAVAYAGYDKPDSARAALGRALALDPAVRRALEPRLAERPSLRAKLD